MVATLYRLQRQNTPGFNQLFFSEQKNQRQYWHFNDHDDVRFFKQLGLNHVSFNIEYAAERHLCKQQQELQLKIQSVQGLLAMARCQEKLYRDYLRVPAQARRFKADARLYRRWLRHHGVGAPDTILSQEEFVRYDSNGWGGMIRSTSVTTNPYRLLIIRLRKCLLLMIPLLSWCACYEACIDWLNQYTQYLFAIQAWLFFLPRLLSNLAILTKHVFFPEVLEQDLPRMTRFWIHLERRWPELVNDLVGFTNGMLAFCFFVGPWQWAVIYAQWIVQLTDLGCSLLRTWIEWHKMSTLIADYQLLLNDEMLSKVAREDIEQYIRSLEQQQHFLMQSRWLDLINFSVLLLGVSLMLPFFTQPLIPVLGAVLMVVISFWRMSSRAAQEAARPDDDINDALVFEVAMGS